MIKSDSSFNDQLVVKIPPSIPAQNCETVLDNLQVLKLLIQLLYKMLFSFFIVNADLFIKSTVDSHDTANQKSDSAVTENIQEHSYLQQN